MINSILIIVIIITIITIIQTDVDHHYTTTKAMIRRATRGGPASHERTQRIYDDKGSKVNRKEESQLGRRDQVTLGRLRSGPHPEL